MTEALVSNRVERRLMVKYWFEGQVNWVSWTFLKALKGRFVESDLYGAVLAMESIDCWISRDFYR